MQPTTSIRSSEDTEADRVIMASLLSRAGLRGAYVGADCALGHEVFERSRSGRGTYLSGPPGRGKTWAAACCVRLAVEAGRDALLITSKRLLDMVRDDYAAGFSDSIGWAASHDLLALDDLGLERPTEWAMETLCSLVDERVAAGLPTVVTSNFTVGQLRNRWGGVHGARLASRLGGACERIEVAGPDRRLAEEGAR